MWSWCGRIEQRHGGSQRRARLARKLGQLIIESANFFPLILSLSKDGMNQTALGKAVGRSQGFVSNYERGQGRLDLPDLILVCRVFRVEPREVLERLIDQPF